MLFWWLGHTYLDIEMDGLGKFFKQRFESGERALNKISASIRLETLVLEVNGVLHSIANELGFRSITAGQ